MGQLTRNEVFTLAVQRYSDTVYRTAVHNCRCTADAEDVVQDVFEKLLHYNGIFESEEHLKAWLLRVAINRCRDLPRAGKLSQCHLSALLRRIHCGRDRADDGGAHKHGTKLAAARTGTVTYDAEGGDRR